MNSNIDRCQSIHKQSATLFGLLFVRDFLLLAGDFLHRTSDPRRRWNGRHKQTITGHFPNFQFEEKYIKFDPVLPALQLKKL